SVAPLSADLDFTSRRGCPQARMSPATKQGRSTLGLRWVRDDLGMPVGFQKTTGRAIQRTGPSGDPCRITSRRGACLGRALSRSREYPCDTPFGSSGLSDRMTSKDDLRVLHHEIHACM